MTVAPTGPTATTGGGIGDGDRPAEPPLAAPGGPVAATRRAVQAGALLLAIAAAIVLLIWLVTGVDPATSGWQFFDGAFGDQNTIARTLVRAIPLALVGLGATIALRGGVVNVGGEGQMAIGAVFAVLAVQAIGEALPGPFSWVAALICGAVGGAFWAIIPAVLAATRNVSEILSTLLMNLITTSILLYLLGLSLFADPNPLVITPQGKPIPERSILPVVWPNTTLHAGIVVAIVAAAACWWWQRTPDAVRTDLVGANPNLAAQAGLRPRRVRTRLLFVSAAFAGVAGAIQLIGVSERLTVGLTGGIGYVGVLVAVLGGRNPIGTVAAAIGFAALVSGGEALEFEGVPRSVAVLTQAVAVVAVAVVSARRTRA
jgi:simple sugar transport system permease protein